MKNELLLQENQEINSQEYEELSSSAEEKLVDLEIEKEIMRIQSEIEVDKELILEQENFDKGIKDSTYFVGFYNTLVSSGLSNAQAYEAMMNQMNIIHAQRISEMELEKAKYQFQVQSL